MLFTVFAVKSSSTRRAGNDGQAHSASEGQQKHPRHQSAVSDRENHPLAYLRFQVLEGEMLRPGGGMAGGQSDGRSSSGRGVRWQY